MHKLLAQLHGNGISNFYYKFSITIIKLNLNKIVPEETKSQRNYMIYSKIKRGDGMVFLAF
jgi:hypothetical protein